MPPTDRPVARRTKYVARLESGHVITMICPSPLTASEAGQVIRQKFRQSGTLIKKECGDPV